MTETRGSSGITLDPVYAAVFALFGWLVGTGQLGDNSFLWHLRAGDLIRSSGIPRTDVFSFTASGEPWIAQSWLAEVVYSGLNDGFGAWSIRAFTGLLAATTAVVVFETARRIMGARVPAAAMSVVALTGAGFLWNERPLMIGVLLFAVLVAVVELPDSWLGRHAVWVLPPLWWLWVNVHGSWMLGLAYVGLHLLGRWFEGSPPWAARERSLLVGTGIGMVASIANPYGLALLTFPVELVGRGDVLSRVREWQSPSARSAYGIALIVWLGVLIFSFARGRARPGVRDVLVTFVFVALALWAVRNVVLLPIATLPIVARAWAGEREPAGARSTVNVAVLALLVVAGVGVGFQRLSGPAYSFAGYPTETFAALAAQGDLDGRLLTTDGWGGYVIWRYWPERQVFMDDRYDMYPVEQSERYFRLLDGREGVLDELDDAGVDVVVWPADEPLTGLLAADARWQVIEIDLEHQALDLATAFVRTG